MSFILYFRKLLSWYKLFFFFVILVSLVRGFLKYDDYCHASAI